MSEKQIVMSKTEFDEMEQKLKALNEIVASKTTTAIFRHNYGEPASYSKDWYLPTRIGTQISIVIGADENKIIKELSDEIEQLRQDIKDYDTTIFSQGQEMRKLREKNENHDWKKLPWYKRLFVK